MAANHLSTAVSELPEYLAKTARNVSGVQTGGGGGSGKSVHNEDGTINTGHIPNWRSISFKERKIVIDERNRLGIKYKESGAGAGGSGNIPSTDYNRIQKLKEQNQKYKRAIKALKRSNMDDVDDDAEEDLDAGDKFRGKASKKKKKTKLDT